jgi:hypothetical protein
MGWEDSLADSKNIPAQPAAKGAIINGLDIWYE